MLSFPSIFEKESNKNLSELFLINAHWRSCYDNRRQREIKMHEFIGDLLFLQNYGYPVLSATGVLWYLNALFFSIWILYPIIRSYYAVFQSTLH